MRVELVFRPPQKWYIEQHLLTSRTRIEQWCKQIGWSGHRSFVSLDGALGYERYSEDDRLLYGAGGD